MGEKTTVIREMMTKDAAALALIEKESFTSPWSEEAFLQEVENSLACYFVIEKEDEVIGYIGTWIVVGESQITNVAIHPTFRGMGLSKRLMAYFFEKMKEKKVNSISLEVRPSNTKAIRLYQQFGFKEIGRRKEYYLDNKEDALLFEVKINER